MKISFVHNLMMDAEGEKSFNALSMSGKVVSVRKSVGTQIKALLRSFYQMRLVKKEKNLEQVSSLIKMSDCRHCELVWRL